MSVPPEDRKTLKRDSGRWMRGDWTFDPEKDEAWEDPKIWRRRIGTPEELEAVADAIVRGYEVTDIDPDGLTRRVVLFIYADLDPHYGLGKHVAIESLHRLIVAVQSRADLWSASESPNGGSHEKSGSNQDLTASIDGPEYEDEVEEVAIYLRECVVLATHTSEHDFIEFDIECPIFATVRFASDVDIQLARFNCDFNLSESHFAGQANFYFTSFSCGAIFYRVRFSSAVQIMQVGFDSDTGFSEAIFYAAADFTYTHFAGRAQFFGARFSDRVSFDETTFADDVGFDVAQFKGDASFFRARFLGEATYDDATLDQRLSFDRAHFAENARLSFHRFLARGGATIELTEDQLRLSRPSRHPKLLARLWRLFVHWINLARPASIMAGGDSDDPRLIDKAAGDYELLAANYARQPATDDLEDGCRFMAHELRRTASHLRAWKRVRDAAPKLRPRAPLPYPRHIVEWLWITAIFLLSTTWRLILATPHALWTAVVWTGWFFAHACWNWGIRRTAIGYLLEWQRILVSGAILILLFTLFYQVSIDGPGIISHGNFGPEWCEATQQFVYSDKAFDYWNNDRLNPLYLSLMTFVTLGYGDFQPAAGWLKLVTGIEGLLGVTLLALFTVAWGRKLVR